MNGSSSHKGRVEIFLLGQWGTICDRYWDLVDATVVCHQLGYLRAVGTPRYDAFGAGSGPSWYSNVRCAGSEHRLTECSNSGLTGTVCSHSGDAGAICTS